MGFFNLLLPCSLLFIEQVFSFKLHFSPKAIPFLLQRVNVSNSCFPVFPLRKNSLLEEGGCACSCQSESALLLSLLTLAWRCASRPRSWPWPPPRWSCSLFSSALPLYGVLKRIPGVRERGNTCGVENRRREVGGGGRSLLQWATRTEDADREAARPRGRRGRARTERKREEGRQEEMCSGEKEKTDLGEYMMR
jgi:hypothetical protein